MGPTFAFCSRLQPQSDYCCYAMETFRLVGHRCTTILHLVQVTMLHTAHFEIGHPCILFTGVKLRGDLNGNMPHSLITPSIAHCHAPENKQINWQRYISISNARHESGTAIWLSILWASIYVDKNHWFLIPVNIVSVWLSHECLTDWYATMTASVTIILLLKNSSADALSRK